MRHGSEIEPPNRFESLHSQPELDDVAWDDEYLNGLTNRKIVYLDDASKSIVSENQSPDIAFRFSLNPYRGCAHGCSYCYARPSHEYLGFNAGIDFETKIVVKRDAAKLFRKFLSKKNWVREFITFSGVTDCYQPAERDFHLTRECLEIADEFGQPISIVTKNALVARDVDLLARMAKRNLSHVFLSINSLDPEIARNMEPRTSTPAARLRAVKILSQAGVPTGVMTSPIIPGLNDSEIPSVLDAAKQAGAIAATYILLRLPLTVLPVFEEWVQRVYPQKAEKILGRIRQTRDGKMNDSQFGRRFRGQGEIANQIGNLFRMFRDKHQLLERLPSFDYSHFRVPDHFEDDDSNQLKLF